MKEQPNKPDPYEVLSDEFDYVMKENQELRKTLSEVPAIIQEKEIHIQALLKLVEVYRNACTPDCNVDGHGIDDVKWCSDKIANAERSYEETIKR